MSKFLHTLVHVGAIALNVATLASGVIPPPYNIIVSAVTGAIQAGVGIYNHGNGKAA
jgi:hypothetical protein